LSRPFLQIITRCYQRPNMLANNMASIRAQIDSDWQQTLLHDEVGRGVQWANAMLGAYADNLVGEYIWVLDDDDKCIHDTLIEELKAIVAERNPDVIMLRGDIGHYKVLPDGDYWGAAPTHSHIGMSCFVVRREVWQKYAYAFRPQLGADFMFIAEVYKNLAPDKIYWHGVIAFEVQRISSGSKEHGSLAIVSCVYNRPERLRHTLKMLEAQTLQIFQLILVNNNPDIADYVDECVALSPLPITVIHNEQNKGSFARIEIMHQYGHEYDYFLTLDDDADINKQYVDVWWQNRSNDEVRGWKGFYFRPGGNYWQRTEARIGSTCHYLWGSGVMVPSWVAADPAILELDERYWMAEDLWLSYYANHVLDIPLRRTSLTLNIIEDGKDSYGKLRQVKIDMLNELRARGWQV
jgi:hypothetical protein